MYSSGYPADGVDEAFAGVLVTAAVQPGDQIPEPPRSSGVIGQHTAPSASTSGGLIIDIVAAILRIAPRPEG